VSAVDANTAWVVGASSTILKTTNGGDTWEFQQSGTSGNLTSVSAVDAYTAWVADGTGTILKTANGGATWVPKGEGIASYLRNVSAVDAYTAWAANHQELFKTTDGGETWTTIYETENVNLPGSVSIFDICAVDSSNVWVVGSYKDGTTEVSAIYKTGDGGKTWVFQYSLPDVNYFRGVSAVDASTAWVISDNGTVLRTTDGGATWASPGKVAGPFYAINAVNATTAWATTACWGGPQVEPSGAIYKTTDGGATWVSQRSGKELMNAVATVSSTTAWVVGSGGIILKTTDGGDNWSEKIDKTLGLMDNLRSVSAIDANTAWAASNGIIFKTTDGGATWARICQSLDVEFYDVCAVDENNVWVVGRAGDASSGTGFIYKSTDGGATWTPQYTLPGTPKGVSAIDSSTAWVVGSNGIILKTTDGGVTWVSQVSGTTRLLSSVSAIDADRAWVSGWSTSWYGDPLRPYPPFDGAPYYPIIIKTTDGGATWAAKQLGTYNEGFDDISAADADAAIAVGKDIVYIPWFYPGMEYQYYCLWVLGTYGILTTHDGGNNWFPQAANVPFTLYGVDMVDSETAWAVGSGGTVLKTTDGGESGGSQVSGTVVDLNDIDAVDACTAWAVGKYGTILKTTDGGDARPDIVSILPTTGDVGAGITISGCDFGATQDSSYVFFGGIQAAEYISWSDDQIVVKVPAGVAGKVTVTVTTPEGTSNGKPFIVPFPAPSVTSIAPNQAMQFTFAMEVTDLAGAGFQPGAAVRLEKGTSVINAYNVNVVSENKITCTVVLFGVEPGVYDVVVTNTDGQEARLPGAFTVTSACGEGSGTALLMLGISLGLLSLAGSSRLRRRRR